MNLSRACLRIGFLSLAIAACGGRVSGPGSSGGGGGGGGANGSLPPGETDTGDAGEAWDGWSRNAASGASGPAPACDEQPVACGQLFPGETSFTNSQEAANALVGRWLFCQPSDFHPSDQIGEEYAADGTYYALIEGPNGQPARDLNPESISHWQIDLTPDDGIEVHTHDGGVQVGGGLSACPASLDLVVLEQRIP